MIVIGKPVIRAWAQYQPSTNLSVTTGSTAPASGIFNLSVDRESKLDGLFDKPSATEIRALVAMNTRISFGTAVTSNVNNSGFGIYILRNGARIPYSVSGGRARNRTVEPYDANSSFRLVLAANDTISLEMVNLETLNTCVGVAARTVVLVEALELL